VSLGADPAGFVEAARAAAIPLTVVRSEMTEETARYGANLILVRPDRFVAWTGDSAGNPAAILAAATGH
jgi:hypothetical protein